MGSGAATVTILFTDLVDSTVLLERAGDQAAQHVFRAHHRLLSEAVARHGGHEVTWLGDGLMVAFPSAVEAARCAIAMQQSARRPAAGERLRIRVGLHAGEALRDPGDYFGLTVVIARRLCDGAAAGQIQISDIVERLLRSNGEFVFEDQGAHRLKGIAEPVSVFELKYEHDPVAMLTHTPFVGRADEIAALRRRFEAARAGEAGVVMLVGEPGIGKTRAAEEFCEGVRGGGARVLWGRCYDGEWAPPFSPFVEMLREYTREAGVDELREVLGANAGVLARIVPLVLDRLPATPEPAALPAEGERFRLLEAVCGFISKLCAKAPAVVVLDDLHWADAGTLAILLEAARTLKGERLLIVGTYRDVEVDRGHRLTAAAAELRRTARFERVTLQGLAQAEVGELLDVVAEQAVAPAFVATIAGETSGNPYFIREVLLHLIDTGAIAHEDGRWSGRTTIAEMGIPEGVREVIGRRLSKLSDASRGALTIASEFTGGFAFEEIAAVMPGVRLGVGLAVPRDEAGLLDAFDEALAAQLIVAVSRGKYDFPHALVRHTLYEGLSEPRRVRLHAQVAEGLEAKAGAGADAIAGQLAGRFAEAASLTAEYAAKALRYSRIAAEQAEAQFAFDAAARHYERCVELLSRDAGASAAEEAVLLRALGRCLRNTGEYRQAWRTFGRAIQRFEDAGDGEGLARTALEALDIDVPPNRFVPLLEKALDAIGDRDLHLRAQLLTLWLTAPAVVSTSTREQRRKVRIEVEETAREHHFDDVEARLLYVDASRAGRQGDYDTSWKLFDQARRELERLGLIGEVAKVMYGRSTSTERSGDLAKAQEVAEANLAWVQRHHMRYEEVHIAACLASVLLLRCDFEGFDAHTRDRAGDFTIVTPSLLAVRAEMRGDFASAMQHLDLVVAGRVPGYVAHMRGIRARILLHAGRRMDAEEEYRRMREAVDSVGSDMMARAEALVWGLITLDETFAELADSEMMALAERIADAGNPTAAADPNMLITETGSRAAFSPPGAKYIGRVYAGVILARGRVEEAEQRYLAALEVCERAGAWIEVGRCLLSLAEIAEQRGDREAARGQVERAAGIFEKYGATLYLGWAREASGRL